MWITKKASLNQNIESNHENVAYPCEQCEYKVTQKPNLKQHIESIHGNVTYPYTVKNEKSKREKKPSREGFYSCFDFSFFTVYGQYEYKETLKSYLKNYIKPLHRKI